MKSSEMKKWKTDHFIILSYIKDTVFTKHLPCWPQRMEVHPGCWFHSYRLSLEPQYFFQCISCSLAWSWKQRVWKCKKLPTKCWKERLFRRNPRAFKEFLWVQLKNAHSIRFCDQFFVKQNIFLKKEIQQTRLLNLNKFIPKIFRFLFTQSFQSNLRLYPFMYWNTSRSALQECKTKNDSHTRVLDMIKHCKLYLGKNLWSAVIICSINMY